MALKAADDKTPLFDDDMLADIILNFLIAGRDTTAQALAWTTFCLMGLHPGGGERNGAAAVQASLRTPLSTSVRTTTHPYRRLCCRRCSARRTRSLPGAPPEPPPTLRTTRSWSASPTRRRVRSRGRRGGGRPRAPSSFSFDALQAAFLEALRLYPSVPKDAKRAVEADTLPGGIHVPAGSNV